MPQTMLHASQFALSVSKFLQLPEQAVCPPLQVVVQAPLEQT